MNNKRIFGLALLLVACTLALPAADFGLQLLNVSAFWQRIVQGLTIIIVVVFDQWRRRRIRT